MEITCPVRVRLPFNLPQRFHIIRGGKRIYLQVPVTGESSWCATQGLSIVAVACQMDRDVPQSSTYQRPSSHIFHNPADGPSNDRSTKAFCGIRTDDGIRLVKYSTLKVEVSDVVQHPSPGFSLVNSIGEDYVGVQYGSTRTPDRVYLRDSINLTQPSWLIFDNDRPPWVPVTPVVPSHISDLTPYLDEAPDHDPRVLNILQSYMGMRLTSHLSISDLISTDIPVQCLRSPQSPAYTNDREAVFTAGISVGQIIDHIVQVFKNRHIASEEDHIREMTDRNLESNEYTLRMRGVLQSVVLGINVDNEDVSQFSSLLRHLNLSPQTLQTDQTTSGVASARYIQYKLMGGHMNLEKILLSPAAFFGGSGPMRDADLMLAAVHEENIQTSFEILEIMTPHRFRLGGRTLREEPQTPDGLVKLLEKTIPAFTQFQSYPIGVGHKPLDHPMMSGELSTHGLVVSPGDIGNTLHLLRNTTNEDEIDGLAYEMSALGALALHNGGIVCVMNFKEWRYITPRSDSHPVQSCTYMRPRSEMKVVPPSSILVIGSSVGCHHARRFNTLSCLVMAKYCVSFTVAGLSRGSPRLDPIPRGMEVAKSLLGFPIEVDSLGEGIQYYDFSDKRVVSSSPILLPVVGEEDCGAVRRTLEGIIFLGLLSKEFPRLASDSIGLVEDSIKNRTNIRRLLGIKPMEIKSHRAMQQILLSGVSFQNEYSKTVMDNPSAYSQYSDSFLLGRNFNIGPSPQRREIAGACAWESQIARDRRLKRAYDLFILPPPPVHTPERPISGRPFTMDTPGTNTRDTALRYIDSSPDTLKLVIYLPDIQYLKDIASTVIGRSGDFPLLGRSVNQASFDAGKERDSLAFQCTIRGEEFSIEPYTEERVQVDRNLGFGQYSQSDGASIMDTWFRSRNTLWNQMVDYPKDPPSYDEIWVNRLMRKFSLGLPDLYPEMIVVRRDIPLLGPDYAGSLLDRGVYWSNLGYPSTDQITPIFSVPITAPLRRALDFKNLLIITGFTCPRDPPIQIKEKRKNRGDMRLTVLNPQRGIAITSHGTCFKADCINLKVGDMVIAARNSVEQVSILPGDYG